MKVLEYGHTYEVANKELGNQIIKFFKNLPEGDPSNHDGILSQELLRILTNRYLELYAQKPCKETHKIIKYLRKCLILSETRAFRLTLGKSYAKSGRHVEDLPVCKNGHFFELE